LPSSRVLATDLAVSRNTVVSVFDSLVAEGVLTAAQGSGTFVARATHEAMPAASFEVPGEPRFDLRPGRPERGSFPTAKWLNATRHGAAAAESHPGAFPDAGTIELRSAVAAYLARARGVDTDPHNIVVCSGFRGACTLLATVLRRLRRTTVAVEDPSLPAAPDVWTAAGLQVVDLGVDAEGAVVEQLDDTVDAAVVTAAHQFPLGGTLAPQRRLSLLDWATRHDAFVIEDDYDGEFRFDKRPIAALQRSDPDHVIYIGSTSKTLDPHLRLGWLVLPTELYAPRRNRLQRALGDLGIMPPGIPAGLHSVVPVPDDEAVVRIADVSGLALHTLGRYSRGPHDRAMVVGFATPRRHDFSESISHLVDALARARS